MAKRGLNYCDLNKPFHKGEFKGQKRYVKVIDKIKNKDPFELTNGDFEILNFIDDKVKQQFINGDINNLSQKKVFISDDNKKLSIGAVRKNSEFGGLSGYAGDNKTSFYEAVQCLWCSLVFNVRKKQLDISDSVSDTQWERAYQMVCVNQYTLDDLVSNTSDDWKKSSIYTANLIYENLYRRSSIFSLPPNLLTSKYSEIIKYDHTLRKDINKWNPSDIYMTINDAKFQNKLYKEIQHANTIESLNEIVARYAKEKTFVGISLKKIDKRGIFEFVNNANKKIEYDLIDYKFGSDDNIFNSIDVSLVLKNQDTKLIRFRSFENSMPLHFSGELQGRLTNHGKIGFGAIKAILAKHEADSLPDRAVDITKKIRNKDIDLLVEEIYNMVELLRGNQNICKNEIKSQSDQWLYSKYLGLKILTAILRTDNNTKRNIVSDMYAYASSSNSDSAIHAKVY